MKLQKVYHTYEKKNKWGKVIIMNNVKFHFFYKVRLNKTKVTYDIAVMFPKIEEINSNMNRKR